MEITWDGDAPKCTHPLTDPEQIDTLEVPSPDSGLNTKYIEWVRAMQEAAADLDVRLNGEAIDISVSHSHGGGPIPAAFALAGENMLMWMLSDPERMHRLMDTVTRSHLNCVRFFDEMYGRDPDHGVWLGADTAEMLSPDLFREFVVPYYERVWEVYPKRRVLHMCGKIDHLLEIIRDEMKLDFLSGFGFPTDRHKLADCMAGRAVMLGGPSPMLVSDDDRAVTVPRDDHGVSDQIHRDDVKSSQDLAPTIGIEVIVGRPRCRAVSNPLSQERYGLAGHQVTDGLGRPA